MKKAKQKTIRLMNGYWPTDVKKNAQEVHREIAFRICFYRNIGAQSASDAMVELQRQLMHQQLSMFKP